MLVVIDINIDIDIDINNDSRYHHHYYDDIDIIIIIISYWLCYYHHYYSCKITLARERRLFIDDRSTDHLLLACDRLFIDRSLIDLPITVIIIIDHGISYSTIYSHFYDS